MRRARLLTVLGVTALLVGGVSAPASAQTGVGGASGGMLLIVGAVAAGVAAFLLIIILFGKAASSRTAQVRGRLGSLESPDESARGLFGRFRLLRRAASRAEGMAEDRGALGMIETALEQANLPIRAGEAIVGMIALSLLMGLVIGALAQSVWWGVATAVIMLVIAVFAVNTVASRQRKRFENQLPDTLNLIATSLRAGYSLLQAVEAVGQEAPEPTRREFGRAMSEIRLGRSVTDALQDIAVRMESQDFDWAVLAISIQREVGGNLAEVLQTTAETMLHRNRLRREMKALTAEGRISAIVLGGLPFFLFGVIFVMNNDYIQPLITTGGGLVALAVSLLLILFGIFWLTRIVKVDI
jgi:tight adherence protein B